LLRCSGDEDRSTQSLRRTALSRSLCAERDLVVDMSDLEFADTSLMLDLAMVARRLRKAGATMHISGAKPHVQTLIELMGLHRLPSVHVLPEPTRA
jgi:anti-anti-sigma factor